MVTTNIIQASIECFGAIICILEIVLFNSLINAKKKSGKFLVLAVTGNIFMLMADVTWNLVDGRSSSVAVVANRISNFTTFIANAFVISTAILYIYEILRDSGISPDRTFFRVQLSFMSVAELMAVINIFYPLLYDFTEDNKYYRLTGWNVYTALIIVTLVSGLVYIIIHRKDFDRQILWSLLIFYGMPCIGSIFQAMLGGAYVNAGCTLGLLVIGFVYIQKWIEAGNSDSKSKKKSYRIFTNLFLIMSICMIAVLFSSMLSLSDTYSEQAESNNRVIAYMVNESIAHSLTEPITVADTMSQSANLRAALLKEELPEDSDEEQQFINYLASIRDGFGYQMVFAASDSTRNYYTYKGLKRHLDTVNDEHDVWYSDIWTSNQKYVFNVDTDEDNGMALALFVNMKVTDKEGKAIGICGVAVPMEEIRENLAALEKEYGIKIRLAKGDGLVELDSDEANIENLYIDNSYFDQVGDEFLYENDGITIRMTKYISDFDWYLVITKDNDLAAGFAAEITPCIVITILGIIIMTAIYLLFRAYEAATDRSIAEKEKTASHDELTGLHNRYALEKYRTSEHSADWRNNLAIIVMDVNGLKGLNDEKGHSAGDELIKSAAECISAVSDRSYRTGGDEFCIYIEDCTQEILDDTLSRLQNNFAACKGTYFDEMTVSVGAVLGSDFPELSLTELEELADERMYADKSAYYKRTGKDRRKN